MGQLLTFKVQPQQESEWCWLAVTASIDTYYSQPSAWTQCLLANDQLFQQTCCQDGKTADCNKPGSLQSSLGRVQRLRNSVASPILFLGVQQEIDSLNPVGRPIAVGITWPDGDTGHAVIIVGWDSTAGEDYVYVADPADGSTRHIPYSTFLVSYDGKGTWNNTYFTEP